MLNENAELLVWSDQLSVGNNAIDNDHKYLINIINEVKKSLETKNRAELKDVLEALSDYSLVHFEREERIAEAAGYAQTPHLSESHKQLFKQLDNLKAELNAMGEDWPLEANAHCAKFLSDWLINHVMNEDLLMKPLLKTFSPSFDAS